MAADEFLLKRSLRKIERAIRSDSPMRVETSTLGIYSGDVRIPVIDDSLRENDRVVRWGLVEPLLEKLANSSNENVRFRAAYSIRMLIEWHSKDVSIVKLRNVLRRLINDSDYFVQAEAEIGLFLIGSLDTSDAEKSVVIPSETSHLTNPFLLE